MNVPTIGQNFDITGYNTVKCSGNPEADAQNFATANGISVEQAKAILQGQFGAPGAAPAQNNTATAGVTNVTADPEPELAENATLDLEDTITNNTQDTSYTHAKSAQLQELAKIFNYTLSGNFETDKATLENKILTYANKLYTGGETNINELKEFFQIHTGDAGLDVHYINEAISNAKAMLELCNENKDNNTYANELKSGLASVFGTQDKSEIITRFESLWAGFWADPTNAMPYVMGTLGIADSYDATTNYNNAVMMLRDMRVDVIIMANYAS